MSSMTLGKLLKTPEYDKGEYSQMMEQGVEAEDLEDVLWQEEKVLVWKTDKDNQQLNFHANNLMPQWMPQFKLICNRLIPTTHTSHVTVERAVLLYAMIKKENVDTR